MDHKFSEIDHVTPLFKFFLVVVHLQTHSVPGIQFIFSRSSIVPTLRELHAVEKTVIQKGIILLNSLPF